MAYGYAAEALAKAKKGDTVLIEGSLDAFPPKEDGGEASVYIKATVVKTIPRAKADSSGSHQEDDIPFG